MTITFFQKYPKSDEDQSGPKSYRLDHDNFGDVLRTVYAKGVITDFEKIQDDPIQVKSRVKVEIEGYGESDYIPLFFHPKALYWDGPDEILATDFNAEGKYHEKAWMSFRGGDEVVVLMQPEAEGDELKPVAVLGFADGVPRIGESIIKVDYTTLHYLDDTKIYTIDGETSEQVLWQDTYIEYLPEDHFRYLRMVEYEGCYTDHQYNYYGDLDEEKLGPDDINLALLTEITNSINDVDVSTTTGFWTQPLNNWTVPTITVGYKYYTRYVIPVGALLYVIEYLWSYNTFDATADPYPGHSHKKATNVIDIIVQAGLNSLENYEAAISKNTKTPSQRWDDYFDYSWDYEWSEVIDGFTRQESLDCLTYVFYNFNYDDIPHVHEKIPDMGNLKFYVRPHTKEELIAAEMWPKEE